MTSVINLSDLNGSNGFVVNGIDADDFSGASVSSAGDVNGDGIDDIIIGARRADPNGNSRAGESYVVFGSDSGFGTSLDLSNLNGSNGFTINGIDTDNYSGTSVSDAGDINGDGIADIIIGARHANLNGNSRAGESYVVFGRDSGFDASLDLSTLNGSNGFVVNGIDVGDESGRSVSSAGDVNGDGIDDIIIGASSASPNGNTFAGESYVVFGRNSGFEASLELSSLDGSNGFVLNGIDGSDISGYSVSSAGDVNGDGFDDIIIGAPAADSNGNADAGESYVVFGSTSGFDASFDLSQLNGNNGFVINGIDAGDLLGISVSSAGDVNGDDIDDIIVGALGANDFAGQSHVIFGSTSGFGASFDLSQLNGSNGFTMNGLDRNDYSGYSVSSAGDVNGDGFDDIIIGAREGSPNGNNLAGESYVIFGSDSGFGASLDLSNLDTSDGFTINGVDPGDFSGGSVSGAGDVNGDGFDDIIIGAFLADPNGNIDTGESYVVFGFSTGPTIFDDDLSFTPADETIDALAGDDIIRGRQGDDHVFGNDGNDRLFGNLGDDTIDGGANNDDLFGGSENDLLIGGSGNDVLNGGSNDDTLIGVDENLINPGAGERDTLAGGQGADLYILGNENAVFYDDDGTTLEQGYVGRAFIRNFDIGVDRIQLHGTASDYLLEETRFGRTQIFETTGSAPELIAVVRDTVGLDLSDSSTFMFV